VPAACGKRVGFWTALTGLTVLTGLTAVDVDLVDSVDGVGLLTRLKRRLSDRDVESRHKVGAQV
jgi:hypothetical protein